MYLIAIGEIFLKGKNRISFERKLIKNIRSALALGPNDLIKFRNRYLIKKDIDINKIRTVFGVLFYTKVIETTLDKINEAALSLVTNEKSFRVTAKKSITLNKSSQELNEQIGSYIVEKLNLKVNLENPEIDIRVEDLSNRAFLYKASEMIRCEGGLPLGSGGFVQLRVNDEINSTVVGFLLMKRGCVISISKELPLLNKFCHGFNLRVREEKEEDIVATDETIENLNNKEETKFILKPLIGYTKKEIKELYNKTTSL